MAPKALIVPAWSTDPTAGTARTALQRVANRPILCHVLERIQQAGLTEILLIVSEQEHAAVRGCLELEAPPELEIEYLSFGQQNGAGEAWSRDAMGQALCDAADRVGEDACLVHVAEGLLDQPLEPLLARSQGSGHELVVFASQQEDSGSIGLATRRLLQLAQEAPQARPLDLAGAALFAPGALRHAARARWWNAGALDLVAIAEQLVAAGGRLRVELVDGWQSHRGDVAGLLELNRIALDGARLGHPKAVGQETRVEGGAQIHPTASVQSSTIVGPVIIGPGAVVLDSYIGPYTSIGDGVHIEGAEVERSIILPGAKIAHIGGRLVGSVVGRDAKVFRDFSLPRALRLNVGDGGEVALC
ncbi:MAG TPA: NDP-sugar synthase [Solirubrobacteraceae bacterium]|nr:NDP-sugar synthase [Solirubrobacteraceae bacterium]